MNSQGEILIDFLSLFFLFTVAINVLFWSSLFNPLFFFEVMGYSEEDPKRHPSKPEDIVYTEVSFFCRVWGLFYDLFGHEKTNSEFHLFFWVLNKTKKTTWNPFFFLLGQKKNYFKSVFFFSKIWRKVFQF